MNLMPRGRSSLRGCSNGRWHRKQYPALIPLYHIYMTRQKPAPNPAFCCILEYSVQSFSKTLNSVCYTLLKQQLFIHPRGDSESVSGVVPCIPTSLVFLVGMLEALINYCLQSTGKFSSESCYRNASCCTITCACHCFQSLLGKDGEFQWISAV